MQNLKRIIFISCFLLSNYMISGACDDYPYSHGDIDILSNTEEDIKILATAGEVIRFDGVGGIVEAQEIAELNALFIIAEFFEVEITEICNDFPNRVCEISKNIPDGVVKMVKKGATKVDMCVEDRMVMVTVGFSSSK